MEQQPLQPPDVRTSPYSSPMHQFGSSILYLTNPDNEIGKMELTFRSQFMDKEGNAKQAGEALMNELGISSVTGTVQSLVNQVTIMSNLDKGNVPMLMDFIGDTLARDLMVNRVNYEIRNFASMDKIYFTALATTFITLKRGYEEGDKRFWKGSVQEIHSRVEGGQKKGLFSSLNPFNKN